MNLGERAAITEVLDFAGDEAGALQVRWNGFLLDGGGGGGFLLFGGEALLEPGIVGVVVVGGGEGFGRRK